MSLKPAGHGYHHTDESPEVTMQVHQQPTRRPPTSIPTHRSQHDTDLVDNMDDLLDEIDGVLEEEHEFLLRYRQKGGE